MKIKLPEFPDMGKKIAYLVENKKEIIRLAKAVPKRADAFFSAPESGGSEVVTKDGSLGAPAPTDVESTGKLDRTIVGNTYYWMDSHDDVHIGGCFEKSITGKRPEDIFFLHDHLFHILARVGEFKRVYEKSGVPWRTLGVDRDGVTEVLAADATVMRSRNKDVFDLYYDGEISQHSVGMQYMNIQLAVNSEDYKDEKALWDTYFPRLGNPERADEKGYFWVVREAKLFEISCVLKGSNEITGTYETLSGEIDLTKGPSLDIPGDKEQQKDDSPRGNRGLKRFIYLSN